MKDDPKVLLGRRVRELRLKMGVSQEALADMVPVHRTYMGRIEQGKVNISLENIVRIAHTLKVAPKELLSLIK